MIAARSCPCGTATSRRSPGSAVVLHDSRERARRGHNSSLVEAPAANHEARIVAALNVKRRERVDGDARLPGVNDNREIVDSARQPQQEVDAGRDTFDAEVRQEPRQRGRQFVATSAVGCASAAEMAVVLAACDQAC